jgi:hypothetical protein
MQTREVATHYTAKWAALRAGDYATYSTMNPWPLAIGDCVVIINKETGARLVTGHVVSVDDSDRVHTDYEVRVNVNHAGGAA